MNKLNYIYSKLTLWNKYGIQKGKRRYQLSWLKMIVRGRILYNLLGIGEPVKRSIDLAISYSCPLNCTHCYITHLKKTNEKEMTLQHYEKLIKEAMEIGIRTFSFQGGEIFCNKEWRKILKIAKGDINHLTITTNSLPLNENIIDELKELKVDTIFFSMDYFGEKHDEFRGHKGLFDHLLKMIDLVEQKGMKVAINVCVGKFNLYTDNLIKILDYSQKRKIMLEAIFARPLGNFEGKEKEVMLDNKDILYFNENILKKYAFCVRDLSNNANFPGFCPALYEVGYLTPSGHYCPCPYTHISFANVKYEPLSVVYERMKKVKWYNGTKRPCLTACDKKFMTIYNKLIDEKLIKQGKMPTWKDLIEETEKYERKTVH